MYLSRNLYQSVLANVMFHAPFPFSTDVHCKWETMSLGNSVTSSTQDPLPILVLSFKSVSKHSPSLLYLLHPLCH